MKGIEMFGEVSNTNSRGGSQYHSQGLCLGFKKLFAKLQMQTKASPKTHRLVVTWLYLHLVAFRGVKFTRTISRHK